MKKKVMISLVLILCLLLAGCGKTATKKAVNESSQTGSTSSSQKSHAKRKHAKNSSSEKGFSGVEIRFSFSRSQTEASNQMAVWIEDNKGKSIKTVYASSFTAQGGYSLRKDALRNWVSAADPASMKSSELDAATGATPESGICRYRWNGKDDAGNTVPSGTYTVKLEGTLYWSSCILYEGSVDTSKKKGSIAVRRVHEASNSTNEDMIENVSMSYAN